MSTDNNVVNGSLKLVGLPDVLCVESLVEYTKLLPKLLAVSIPNSITNVIVSNIQPLSSQADSVWFRQSNGGAFIGIYMFSGGSWIQVFPAPGEVRWIVGDSASPPPGFILTDDAAWIDSTTKDDLKTFWRPTGSGPWKYFSVVPAVV